jgi:O-antigen ligase
MLILILFFLWLAQGLKKKKLDFSHNFQTFWIILFLFLNLLSLSWSTNIFWSLRKIAFLLSIFPLYFVASNVLISENRKNKLIHYLIYSGTLVALIGILQFLSQFIFGVSKAFQLWSHYFILPFLGDSFGKEVLNNPSWLVHIGSQTYLRAIATFPDPHMLSLFLGMLLPLAISLSFLEKKEKWIISSGLIFIADILTFSRGGYLGLLVGGLIFIVIHWKTFTKRYQHFLILISLIIFSTLLMPNPISLRFFSSFNLKEGSNKDRIVMWKKASKTILHHPLSGVGIGNFPLTVNPLATYRNSIYAHNTYLDISSEAGILAGLAWLGILISAFLNFLKRSQKNIVYLGTSFSLIIFSVHSIVETGIYSPVVLTLLLLLISLNNFTSQKICSKK